MASLDVRERPVAIRRGWVFVSYAHDDESRVRTIVKYLESRGIDVWWDDLLEPGDRWGWVLRQKVNDAACIVVLWSRSSVRSVHVESEVRGFLDLAHSAGRLVPVLLDKEAEHEIPIPFNVYQYHDLGDWNGSARGPLRSLASVLARMVRRPPRSEEQQGPNLSDDTPVQSAQSASTEMRELSQRVGRIGEILISDADAVDDLRAALTEVDKTLDVVANAVEEFVAAGLTLDGLDAHPYVRFERGVLSRRIRDGRGHCDLIALHYARKDGVREWLQSNSSDDVVARADNVFAQLAEADLDLFRRLGQIGEALTNESRIVVNLLTANQTAAARQRVHQGRTRLAPLEADLDKSIEVLQHIEQKLGFAPHR